MIGTATLKGVDVEDRQLFRNMGDRILKRPRRVHCTVMRKNETVDG